MSLWVKSVPLWNQCRNSQRIKNFFLSRNHSLWHDTAPLTGVGSSCKDLMNEKEYNIQLKLEWEL